MISNEKHSFFDHPQFSSSNRQDKTIQQRQKKREKRTKFRSKFIPKKIVTFAAAASFAVAAVVVVEK